MPVPVTLPDGSTVVMSDEEIARLQQSQQLSPSTEVAVTPAPAPLAAPPVTEGMTPDQLLAVAPFLQEQAPEAVPPLAAVEQLRDVPMEAAPAIPTEAAPVPTQDPSTFQAFQGTPQVAAIPGSAENPILSQPQLVTGAQTATQRSLTRPNLSPAARRAALARLGQAEETAKSREALGAQRADTFNRRREELEERTVSLLGREELAQQDLDALNERVAGKREQHEALRQEIAAEGIDRGRLWANRSTGGKILTIIGLMLGAAGRGGRNRAAEVLNKQIEDDVRLQVQQINKKKGDLNDFQVQIRELGGDIRAQRVLLQSIGKERAAAEMERIAAESGSQEAVATAQLEAGKLRDDALKGYAAFEQAAAGQETVTRKRTPVQQRVGGSRVPLERAIGTATLNEHAGGQSAAAVTPKAAKEIRDQRTVFLQQSDLLREYLRALEKWKNASVFNQQAMANDLNQSLSGLRDLIGTAAAKNADPGSVVREDEREIFARATLGRDAREFLTTANAAERVARRALLRAKRQADIFIQNRLAPTTPQATVRGAPAGGGLSNFQPSNGTR